VLGTILALSICWGLGRSMERIKESKIKTDEILKELAFHRMIQRGLKNSNENKTISNQEMKKRIKSYIYKD